MNKENLVDKGYIAEVVSSIKKNLDNYPCQKYLQTNVFGH
jgi:hypothetical protein